MMRCHRLLVASVLLVPLTLGGCGGETARTYRGQALKPDQGATVKFDMPPSDGQAVMTIRAVDGTPASELFGKNVLGGNREPSVFMVPAGEHQLTIHYNWCHLYCVPVAGTHTTRLDTVAGHVYVFRATVAPEGPDYYPPWAHVTVTDETLGERITSFRVRFKNLMSRNNSR